MLYDKVNTDLNFVDREKEVNDFWKKEDIFQKSMKQIDDKSAFLRDVATKVNTACSDDEIKQGLFSLTGSHEIEWNDAEWDEFLSGKKELRI